MELFDTLVHYETTLWNALERVLARAGAVGVATTQALRLVDRQHGEARVQDLASGLNITVGAASKLADRLEREGLAERSAHPTDRRSSVLAVTNAGSDALATAEPIVSATLERFWGSEDLAPLVASLQRLQQRLDQLAAQQVSE